MSLIGFFSPLPSVATVLILSFLLLETIQAAQAFSLIITDGRLIRIHDYLTPKMNDAKTNPEQHAAETTIPPNDIPLAQQTAQADGVLIKHSEGRGLGVFAALPIPSGAWFGEYYGELMSEEQVETRYWKYHDPDEEDEEWVESRRSRNQTISGDYIFDVGDDLYIDGEDTDYSSWCRYINHAGAEDDERYGWNRCNAESRNTPQTWNGDAFSAPKMFFVALRDIAVGEEICFDYGEYYWKGCEDMIA